MKGRSREPARTTLRTVDLPSGDLMPFASFPGERVRIVHGRVWLTEEGSVHDAFLGCGDEVSLRGRGLAVIEALVPARVQLIEAVSGPSVARAAARLGRAASWWIRRRIPRAALRATRGII